jgi:hypothetical protein
MPDIRRIEGSILPAGALADAFKNPEERASWVGFLQISTDVGLLG